MAGSAMTQQKQVYRCYVCGNVVEVLTPGGGELICCGVKMALLKEKTSDTGLEQHLPVVERTVGGIRARVGADPHPMESSHFIEWLEVGADGRVMRQYLAQQGPAEAEFATPAGDLVVRAYCNRHGLWQAHLSAV